MTESLKQRIMRHEGFCHVPKPDHQFNGDAWVIGYGHDITPDQVQGYANGISEADAESLLDTDLMRCSADVMGAFPWTFKLDNTRLGVLIEMDFQIGLPKLKEFKRMLACAEAGDWEGASREMLASEWNKETPDRCAEMANIMLNGGDGL